MQDAGYKRASILILTFPFKVEGTLQTNTYHFEEDISLPPPKRTDQSKLSQTPS
jgi:hypothetical protein